MKQEIILSEKEEAFIDALIQSGGNISAASRAVEVTARWGYILRKKLAKHIAEAAQQYLALHSIQAAKKVIDTMDEEMPNPTRLAAAQAILDRAGVIKGFNDPETNAPVIKANIFILPEKRELTEAIVVEYERA